MLCGLAVTAPTGAKLKHYGAFEGVYFFTGGFKLFHIGDQSSSVFDAWSTVAILLSMRRTPKFNKLI